MDTAAKARENRARRTAARRGYQVIKCRRRDPRAIGYGTYCILTDAGRIAAGDAYLYGMTIGDVEQWLDELPTREAAVLMPLYFSVPLPGPFRYSQRLTRCHYRRMPHRRFGHVWYWLSGAWVLELAFWTLVGTVVVYGLIAWLIIRLTRQAMASPAARSWVTRVRARF